jgi:hypothetical protein
VSSADVTRIRVRMKSMCITNFLFIWIYACYNIFYFVLLYSILFPSTLTVGHGDKSHYDSSPMWSNPLWAQIVADTLPEMAFASAWTLLVSFFVQLVGVALGTGTFTSTGMVIQMTAYDVYVISIATYFWNPLASVLLYAPLCCIYPALFGTTLYFCPRLWTLLHPSLVRHSGLAIRMASFILLCFFFFGGRTVGFARKVVAPPRLVSL